VPSEELAKSVSKSHRKWLRGTRPDGSPRKDSKIRNFRDAEGKYKEAWHLLGL